MAKGKDAIAISSRWEARQVEVKFEPPPPASQATDPYTSRVVAVGESGGVVAELDSDASLLAAQMRYDLKVNNGDGNEGSAVPDGTPQRAYQGSGGTGGGIGPPQ